jgi:hypothetical protein
VKPPTPPTSQPRSNAEPPGQPPMPRQEPERD